MNRILRYINIATSNKNISNSDDEYLTSEEDMLEEDMLDEYISDSETDIFQNNIINRYNESDYEGSGSDKIFKNEWNIWYHHTKNNWKIGGFNNIFKIKSIKEFWDFNNNINIFGGINSHHFFMMKNDITPIWEDEKNKFGGCWSIKIPTEKSLELWIKLSSYIVGETLTENSNIINGISICAKNPITSVVKIWNNSTTNNSIKLLPVEILNEYGFNIIYKSHIPEY